jgi:hypothetical protein
MTDCLAKPQQEIEGRAGPHVDGAPKRAGSRTGHFPTVSSSGTQGDSTPLLTPAYRRPLTVSGLAGDTIPAYSRCMPNKTCKVCLVEHDEEIHAATLSLRQWLREKVNRCFESEQPEEITRPAA